MVKSFNKAGLINFVRERIDGKVSQTTGSVHYEELINNGKIEGWFKSWNWAAFFFGPLWLAYRKMYAYVTFFVLINLLLSFIVYYLWSRTMWISGPLIMVLFGLYGDSLYINFARKKVEKGKTESGTSVFMFTTALIAFLLFALYTFIYDTYNLSR